MVVNLLLANHAAKDLVHRAIAQSGYGTWALSRSTAAPLPAPKNVYMEEAERAEHMSGGNSFEGSVMPRSGISNDSYSRSINNGLYYTDFLAQEKTVDTPGTAHGSDGYFIFAGHLDKNESVRALSGRMQRYWVNFSRAGNPNGEGLLQWPQYKRSSDRWLVFSRTDTVQSGVIAKKLDFLESMYRKRIYSGTGKDNKSCVQSGPKQ